jgi:hypothetical protein
MYIVKNASFTHQLVIGGWPGTLLRRSECVDSIAMLYKDVYLALVEQRQIEGVVDKMLNSFLNSSGLAARTGHFRGLKFQTPTTS